MKEIPLTQGYVALVDDEDFERVSAHKWRAHVISKTPNVLVYAVRSLTRIERKRKHIYMHHFILGAKALTDHLDDNGLNNQRENLRPATYSQNIANARKRGGCASPYRGVGWRKDIQKWTARITKDGVEYRVGYFREECDAALAYNLKAYELFGEFARFNEPLAATA